MAIKAVMRIMDSYMESGFITFTLGISDFNNAANYVPCGPLSVELTDLQMNTYIRDFGKNYCIENWITVFEGSDKIKLMQQINSLV